MVELANCPFCGGQAEIRGTINTEIRCTNDQCISSGAFNFFDHRSAAIAAWNQRLERAPARGEDDTATVERVAIAIFNMFHQIGWADDFWDWGSELSSADGFRQLARAALRSLEGEGA